MGRASVESQKLSDQLLRGLGGFFKKYLFFNLPVLWSINTLKIPRRFEVFKLSKFAKLSFPNFESALWAPNGVFYKLFYPFL